MTGKSEERRGGMMEEKNKSQHKAGVNWLPMIGAWLSLIISILTYCSVA